MSKRTQSIRGMHDILPAQSAIWQALEIRVKDVVSAYGYREIRLPIVEHTELFTRSIGEVTDIVEKEMYTFEDRNSNSLSLRPEGTASCVRAGIEHGLFHNQQQRLWYIGPMFRHERPQKGRYRQFHQIGIETFGFEGPDIDAELIFMSARLWDILGLKNIRLELNSLGTPAVRERYREKLINYLMLHQDELDEDARRRMHTNPMRVLDSKNPDMRDVIESAPNLLVHLDDESQRHFEELKEMLASAGIPFVQNSRLVRGLDYYTKTVFEWTSDQLGAQATICAGGRYDGLVEKLGGRVTPATGFAMGLERMIDLLVVQGIALAQDSVHAYLVMAGERVIHSGQELAEKLRNEISELCLITNCGAGSFKAQLKRADRSGAELALILGEDEISEDTVTVKFLRSEQNQKKIPQSQLAQFLRSHLAIQ